MKAKFIIGKTILIALLLLPLPCLIPRSMLGTQPALSEDDALLLLMGSTPPDRKAEVIRLRGIESNWGEDFQSKLRALCIQENVRAALDQEFRRSAHTALLGLDSAHRTGSDPTPNSDESLPSLMPKAPGLDDQGIRIEVCAYRRFPAPDERLVRRIVERLTNNDDRLEGLLKRYTYHQSLLARQINSDGSVVGTHYQEWDILFDDHGRRIFRELDRSPDSLGKVRLLSSTTKTMDDIQPLVFLPEDRNDYVFNYIDHVALDEITAYQLSVQPRKVERGKPRWSLENRP